MPASLSRELFIVSDLHIGGAPGVDGQRGFCINTQVPLLQAFIGQLAARAASSALPLELLINGDFFDFLAEQAPTGAYGPWSAFIQEPTEALGVYRNIRGRHPALFDALRGLLAAGGDLTLLLGNHDLELSLPAVRTEFLADLDAGGRGRVRFIYDGEAYVAGPDVLIEHGNRYDGFNAVDHDRLRALRSVQSRRMPLPDDEPFVPPPGSRLVEQVMNPIKRDYPFVDLLKPETQAVIPLLLALEPGRAKDLRAVATAAQLQREAGRYQPREPAVPVVAGQRGTHGLPAPVPAKVPPTPSTPPSSHTAASPTDPLVELLLAQLGEDALAGFEALLGAGPRGAGAASPSMGTRGFGEAVDGALSFLRQKLGSAGERARRPLLLAALRRLQNDKSFDPGVELPEVMDHVRRLAQAGFRVIVFGHTHLAKAITEGNCTYLNTGTWADLMRLPAGLFDPDDTVAQATLEAFAADLRAQRYAPHLVFAPSFAHVVLGAAGRVATARLHRFDAAAGLPTA